MIATSMAEWFPLHAQTMDAMLALYIETTGFQPEALVVASPQPAA